MDRLNSFAASVVCSIIMWMLICLWTANLRQADRMFLCSNRLKTLVVGIHHYHSAYRTMPLAVGGTTGGAGFDYVPGVSPRKSNGGRLSGFASLLPFIDQETIFRKLSSEVEGQAFPKQGPVPSFNPIEFPLWSVQIDSLLCPADMAPKQGFGMRSYVMCYGDGIDRVGRLFDSTNTDLRKAVARGGFVPHFSVQFRDIVDGLSNTMLLSETRIGTASVDTRSHVARGVENIVQDPSTILSLFDAPTDGYQAGQDVWKIGKGARWPEGSFLLNAYTSVLPPNSPSATLFDDPESGCLSASSHHPGGVHVAMANGAVRYVANTIDTGQLSAPSVSPQNDNVGRESPYGVWGAMGTIAGHEIIPSEREAKFRSVQ